MTDWPTLVIRVTRPDENGPAMIVLKSTDGIVLQDTLTLPFPLTRIPLLLRALNARQYPDYPDRERFLKPSDDRTGIAALLCELQMWDTSIMPNGCVAANAHVRLGQAIGRALFASQAVQTGLRSLYDAAIRVGEGEIVFCFDPQAAALAALPWEVAHDRLEPILLANGVTLGCTRVITFAHAIRRETSPGEQLRILTIAPRVQMSDEGRAFERLARKLMEDALRDLPVVIEPLPQATMEALDTRLSQGPPVDVLDYYGHGIFTDEGGALLFENAQGGRAQIAPGRLAKLRNLPPLIVLHACQSAQLDPDEPLAGVATALSNAGVHAVVAMQLTTRMTAATNVVAPTLYSELAKGRSVQQAVAEVRRKLYVVEEDGVSWYLPALYLCQADDQPFVPLPKALPAHQAPAIRNAAPAEPPPNPFVGAGAIEDVRRFVGRSFETNQLWQRLKSGGHLTILGDPGSGKSALLSLIATRAREQLQPKTPQIIWLNLYSKIRLADAQFALSTELGGQKVMDWNKLLYRQPNHIILLVDNLHLLDKANSGFDIRNWLRGLAEPRRKTRIQLVVTSLQHLSDLFRADSEWGVSPLHGILGDTLELRPFSAEEAEQFIRRNLEPTPFALEQFQDLVQLVLPGELQTACRQRYDELIAAYAVQR